MDLDFTHLTEEVVKKLEEIQTMTLATYSMNKVTARSMAIVNDGLTIMFQTNGLSEKIRQLSENPNVAFAASNVQIEALAKITNDPEEIQNFIEKFKTKYPQYHAKYSGMPNETTVICTPIRFALYRFIDGKPCADVLDVNCNKAYREILM